MVKCVLFIAAGAAAAMHAAAQTSINPQAVQSTTGHSDANKLICKKEEQIGSRLGAKKVCMTLEQWQARQAADREQTERVQSGARVCANPPCP